MKSDKVLIVVFGLVGLTFGLGFILLSTIDGPGNSIVEVGAHQPPGGNAEMHIWVLGQHVYSRQIASIEDFGFYSDVATYFVRAAIALTSLLLGLAVGYFVSRTMHRRGLARASRSAPPTPRRG